ncbi:MAG TPA: polymer-forming cytoskeletal protein [Phycisphaerae bacterium]|nr:polymer-forming cytoskeletal protein [Phycisphaerae bacterium]
MTAEANGEFPTVIGADAKFKGELSFDKGVRIEGAFDGHITSKGILHVAEGAKVTANIEASNVKVEGECKGNLIVSEKLHLLATAKMEGDLRTNRLEINDGAIFVGNVVVGQQAAQAARRPTPSGLEVSPPPAGPPVSRESPKPPSPAASKLRPQEIRVGPSSA